MRVPALTGPSNKYVSSKEQSETCEAIGSSGLCPPAIIVDLCDAAAFIDMHRVRTQPWVAAETAVKCVDRNPVLID